MKAKKILKGHRWYADGCACTCGPTGHDPSRLERKRKSAQKRYRKVVRLLVVQRGGTAPEYVDGRGLQKDGLPFNQWVRKCRKGEFPCHYCGAVADTIDHKVPRSKGGKITPDNVLPACGPCNTFKGDKTYEEFLLIWKRRRFREA